MFRAFHKLKRNILLDYMKADINGENPDLVNRSPQSHIDSGRPLASYFSGETNFGANPRASEGKSLDGTNLEVHLPVIRDGVADTDALNRDSVIAYTWQNPGSAVMSDLGCIAAGRKTRWLTEKDAKRIEGTEALPDSEWAEHDGSYWIKFHTRPRNVYLKVTKLDLNLDDNEGPWTPDPTDNNQPGSIFMAVITRLTKHVAHLQETGVESRLSARFENSRFHLEDEGSKHIASLEGTHCKIDIANSRRHDPLDSLGSLTASNTIYTVIQQGLNELLDPLFGDQESKDLDPKLVREKNDRMKYARIIHLSRLKLGSERLLHFQKNYQRDPCEMTAKVVVETFATASKGFLDYAKEQHLHREHDLSDLEDMIKVVKGLQDLLEYYDNQEVPVSLYPGYIASQLAKILNHFVSWDPTRDPEVLAVSVPSGEKTTVIFTRDRPKDIFKLQEMHEAQVEAGEEAGTASPPCKPAGLNGSSMTSSLSLEEDQDNVSEFDPTLPHHRPSEDTTTKKASHAQLKYVTDMMYASNAHNSLNKYGPPGSLNQSAFENALSGCDNHGRTLLDWVGGWLDLIMF